MEAEGFHGDLKSHWGGKSAENLILDPRLKVYSNRFLRLSSIREAYFNKEANKTHQSRSLAFSSLSSRPLRYGHA